MSGDLAFEWDDAKADSNLTKHGVPFAYATRLFLDPGMIDIDASRESDREVRRKAVGMIEGRVFTVVYSKRAGVIRIISARRCNIKEARLYEALHPRSE
jgi:uncharacterized DUF497 family protein